MNIKQFFHSKVFILLLVASFTILSSGVVRAQDEGATEAAAEEVAEESTDDSGAPVPNDKAAYAVGEEIFEGECSTCHALDDVLAGPALRKVAERQPVEWIKKWVKNSAALIASGDEHANEVYEKFGKAAMPSFAFNDDQLTGIITYLQYAPEAKTADTTSVGGTSQVVVEQDDSTLVIVLSIILVLLIIIILVLVLMSALLSKHLKSKEDELNDADLELVNQKHNVLKVFTHPAFIGAVTVIAILVGLWLGIVKGLYWVGTQGGYAPSQPINFSHKIHAGENEIDCNYCHTGVRKSKNANIPSPNICMNCHTKVKTESPEIAKIYRAIDYNPETKEYGTNTKPIEWVRIHNLPDLAYFNHSQHVKVGGIECQECHGPIEEMDKVYQYSELTMGWCIDCHRKTEVNAKGNAYYDELLNLHEEKKEGEPMTVEDIGGLECSKCHY